MIHFGTVSLANFLNDYWQKKPLLIRQALPNFVNGISPEELAGLALEEDVESRLVLETPNQKPQWHLKKGPFHEHDFTSLPKTHWTLLVQGMDRIVPEIYQLWEHFDFLPQWRLDDVMISYAALHGSVGPHYDNYDVFLFQAKGQREWRLTTKNCTPENYLTDSELRIMADFSTEDQFLLEEGDMLYLPPHVGHYGIARSEHCMTYSFGYRSYQGQEIWDSLGDFLSEKDLVNALYRDPNWSTLSHTSELQKPTWQEAQRVLQELINNEDLMKKWFGCFATRLDQQAEQQLPEPLAEDELIELTDFIEALKDSEGLARDPCCRFAYEEDQICHLFINGVEWESTNMSPELIKLVANKRFLSVEDVQPFLSHPNNQLFLYELWTLQWLILQQ